MRTAGGAEIVGVPAASLLVSVEVADDIQQTKIPAGETGSLSLNWGPHGWLIVSTPGPNRTSQLAAYNPTTVTFVVSPQRTPADEWLAH